MASQSDVTNAVNAALSLRPITAAALSIALGTIISGIFQPLGGSLTGTLPNPLVATGAITGAMLASGAAVTNGAVAVGGDVSSNTVLPLGGTSRALQSRAADLWTVKEYGAFCDGAHMDTAAFQAAANDYAAHPDITVVGTCLVAGGITVKGTQSWHGLNQNGAKITNTSATTDTFDVSGQFDRFENLYFNSNTTRTAGSYISGTSNRLFIDKIFCDTPFQCISAQGVNVGYFSNVTTFWYATPQANSTIFEIGGNGGDIRISRAYSVGPVGTGPLAAVHVTQTGALAIEDSTFERTGKGLFVDTISGGIGVSSIRTHGTYFDNQQNAGVDIFADGASITRIDFSQSWASSTANNSGIRLRTANGNTIKGVSFSQMQAFLNANNGLSIEDTGVSDVRVVASQFAQNTNSGIYVPAGFSGLTITGSTSGAWDGLQGNKYGLTLGAGAVNAIVTSNDLSNNTSGNQVLTSPSLASNNIITNNAGYTAALTPLAGEVQVTNAEDHALFCATASFIAGPTVHNVVFASSCPTNAAPSYGALTANQIETLPSCTTAALGRTANLEKIENSSYTVSISVPPGNNPNTGVPDTIAGAGYVTLSSQYTAVGVQCDGFGHWIKGVY